MVYICKFEVSNSKLQIKQKRAFPKGYKNEVLLFKLLFLKNNVVQI